MNWMNKTAFLFAAVALCLWGCGESGTSAEVEKVDEGPLFSNCKDASLNVKKHEIDVPCQKDSLKVSSLSSLGGAKYYLALDQDLVDPEIDWDSPLKSGAYLITREGEFANIVVLDEKNRVVDVWKVKSPEVKSSSSKKVSSSSSVKSSSSAKSESSSSVKDAESSSSEEVSSSSEEISSSSEEILSSSAEEPQLPGSDFTKYDASFWGTTSDVMAEATSAGGIKFQSSANLEFASGRATLTTREIVGSFLSVPGSWKIAGGFYFAGSFKANDIVQLYQWNYTSGTPDAGYESDISQGMTFGRPFTARPVSFEVKYSYEHVSNTSTKYPQKSLMYVMLVSADKKVVACGMHSDSESVSDKTVVVELSYGADPDGLLQGGFAMAEGLTLGEGTEEVASIHVMFASSAYAHVVAGGAAGTGKKQRGGKEAKLILDNFKLNY